MHVHWLVGLRINAVDLYVTMHYWQLNRTRDRLQRSFAKTAGLYIIYIYENIYIYETYSSHFLQHYTNIRKYKDAQIFHCNWYSAIHRFWFWVEFAKITHKYEIVAVWDPQIPKYIRRYCGTTRFVMLGGEAYQTQDDVILIWIIQVTFETEIWPKLLSKFKWFPMIMGRQTSQTLLRFPTVVRWRGIDQWCQCCAFKWYILHFII